MFDTGAVGIPVDATVCTHVACVCAPGVDSQLNKAAWSECRNECEGESVRDRLTDSRKREGQTDLSPQLSASPSTAAWTCSRHLRGGQ